MAEDTASAGLSAVEYLIESPHSKRSSNKSVLNKVKYGD
jgi:hypothetical protein